MDAPRIERGQRSRGGLLAIVGRSLISRIDQRLERGAMTVSLPAGGAPVRIGGREAGPEAVVIFHSWRALWRLATAGSVGWYEGWAAGEWESPDPVAIFEVFSLNRRSLAQTGRAQLLWRAALRLWHKAHRNDRAGARRNIHQHYDLGNEFYELWLDPGMTYSGAIFAAPDEPLAAAQDRKLQAILDRTACRPGEHILEIGCGWGSFAEFAAREGVGVHGVTLSTEQRDHAAGRLAELDAAEIELIDYRDATGMYDGVASIEMVEAVGEEYWPDYLSAIARALKPGGRAAIQYIAIDDAIYDSYARSVDFIQRYVFPGGMLLSERRFRALAEQAGLAWQDRHGFGMDYAETLKRWRESFDAVVAAGKLPERFDRHFVDLWRYYLMYCEGGFRGGGIDVAQVTLIKEG